MLLSTVWTVFPVLGLTADELAEKHVALVVELVVNADLRCVVADDRRLLRHDEKRFERRLRIALVAADVREDRVELARGQPDEWRAEPRRGLRVERRQD